jgi:transposase
MDGVVEIITGRERRRRWSTTEKLRIVAEAAEPDAVMRAVAARHGICESLLFTWRRQARTGMLRAVEAPAFVPVQVFDAPLNVTGPPPCASGRTASSTGSPVQSGLIEIELGDGRRVRVGRDVNLAALRRVLAALRG